MTALDEIKNKKITEITALDQVILSESNFGLQGAAAADYAALTERVRVLQEQLEAQKAETEKYKGYWKKIGTRQANEK